MARWFTGSKPEAPPVGPLVVIEGLGGEKSFSEDQEVGP
jgi:hypothetical protein